MTSPMIETHHLTRHFTARKQTVEAVRSLDLRVDRGELVAFLGPNGAGKSTTLRMLTTLLAPTSGTATVAGFDVVRDQREVRRHIGYVGQGNGAGHTQLGRDELLNQGRAYGLTPAAARVRADELIEGLDLGAVVGRQVQTLSGGQRRRLDIALGMIHAPELLFLDEPSTGLDPQNRANLQEQIVRLHREHGTTIVLTTHYLDEADAMAERVVVIDHGSVIADDTSQRLKESLGDRVTLGFTDPDHTAQAQRRIDDGRGEITSVTATELVFRRSGGAAFTAGLIRDLDRADVAVASVEVVRPTLDDVFLPLTGRSLREETDTTDKEIAA
ncbi:ATP-binding cassette domain-containing protein [Nocardioides sp.]|uniref:ATP-binding cassette domain-containing protein n=1 Tax=Nocardioides sp. TaxID=35761 RepID=UPI002735B6F3|nr:ATP-binding cassette domain-containing protein [Nocardioides sp.]MDP3889998.1 ATP-binding cassette domain-containing protein [Nocardioides sp.]